MRESNSGGDRNIKWNDGGSGYYENSLKPYDYSHRKAGLGYYIGVQPKIYFESYGLDGSFIGLSFEHFDYRRSHQVIEASSSVDMPQFSKTSFSEFEKISDILAWYGLQSLYDRISVEYAFGAGLRNLNSHNYAYTFNGQSFIDGVESAKRTNLSFKISLKIGYHY